MNPEDYIAESALEALLQDVCKTLRADVEALRRDAERDTFRKDAERYRKLRAMVRGERRLGTGHNQEFAFPTRFELEPQADIMRGSVAQHLDAAIDALPAVG